ncbi:3-hydroxybutyryl-CoA dehydrogenase [Pseudomonas sp. VS40]|uniref:3-hydroxyacyl-CoA dehydrogenase family protein n=1 Tax=unclassified Pseudomonas TaxID=196821 RepID=UPI001BDF0733|nr:MULTISPECIES: 3-hydroxyacyl-CoA dehydrogenase NAD-binding domain-containing protein [unclassified Pseudomonas]MBT1258748.1 3-hydroxybutyryl-CoA dehydrogenase [Pseudomonas sp. VS40]MBT1271616.1 3-hydroxybutyryl-CoA dehydrogenase [Pseudomonas sp. VS59]
MSDPLIISTVGVIGTGTMGKGIVQILAQCSHVSTVIWKSNSVEKGQRAFLELETLFNRLASKSRISKEDAADFIGKISVVTDFPALSDAQLIVEAVSEDMDAKREVFAKLSHVVGISTILASNTSSLSITELAGITKYPQNVVGLHFFNPAALMRLAEVICGLTTSSQTISTAMEFARKLGKDPVLVNEAPGFIVNRMLIPMINEAIGILAEGVAEAEEIDKAMRLGANHPIGPLALADLIGNDVNLSIMETLHNETGDPKYRAHPLLRKMVRANHLGRKTGQGFFKY